MSSTGQTLAIWARCFSSFLPKIFLNSCLPSKIKTTKGVILDVQVKLGRHFQKGWVFFSCMIKSTESRLTLSAFDMILDHEKGSSFVRYPSLLWKEVKTTKLFIYLCTHIKMRLQPLFGPACKRFLCWSLHYRTSSTWILQCEVTNS